MAPREQLHLAVALDGAGWHPAAWREPGAAPAAELFGARYWTQQVALARDGLLDFVTIEDGFAPQSTRPDGPDERTDQVRGRLDAVLIAAVVAPLVGQIGIVPTVTTLHTEPFHVSKSIATLDYVSTGRAGWRVQLGGRGGETALFGRRTVPGAVFADPNGPEAAAAVGELFDEAADHVEAVRRLWDSWEDDAEIRDAATGRFIDREKLHYIDFAGPRFSVRGPSITPRPPQGQPVVTALAHATLPYRFAARAADVVYVTPTDADSARAIVQEVRAEQAAAGREAEPVHVFADLVVLLGGSPSEAADRKARLDERAGEQYTSDALVFTGTPDELADLLLEWQGSGISGYRLRPAAIPDDLHAISHGLVPALQARGAFRRAYEADTLRGLLGLPRPANRYAPLSTGV